MLPQLLPAQQTNYFFPTTFLENSVHRMFGHCSSSETILSQGLNPSISFRADIKCHLLQVSFLYTLSLTIIFSSLLYSIVLLFLEAFPWTMVLWQYSHSGVIKYSLTEAENVPLMSQFSFSWEVFSITTLWKNHCSGSRHRDSVSNHISRQSKVFPPHQSVHHVSSLLLIISV